MGSGKYILEGHAVVPELDLMTWARWFENSRDERRVDETEFGDIRVSTVFLGLDHNFHDGIPLVFETMIFGMGDDGYCERCSTWEEAEKQHGKAVEVARQHVTKMDRDGQPMERCEMTLREEFVLEAMTALIRRPNEQCATLVAIDAVEMADAVIERMRESSGKEGDHE